MAEASVSLLRAETKPAICILFALREERRPLHSQAAFRRPVEASHSGAGVRNAARGASEALAAHQDRVACLLICGFCGGLSFDQHPGDLVIATLVVDDTAKYSETPLTHTPDSTLLTTAESVRLSEAPTPGPSPKNRGGEQSDSLRDYPQQGGGVKIHLGTLVTGSRVLVTAAEKRALAERTGAQAVDMETAGAVQVAQARGVPWLAVRAITDGVEDDLPLDFNALADADGNVNRNRVVLATLTHPWKIPALIRLGARSSLAANNLAAFLEAFLNALPEKMP